MGKFSNTGRTSGGSSALQRLAESASANVRLPVEPAEDATVQNNSVPTQAPITQTGTGVAPAALPQTQFPPIANDPSISLRRAEELPSPIQPEFMDPQQQMEMDLAAQQRNRVPNLRERAMAQPSPDFNRRAVASSQPDGGIFDRANRMAEAVALGGLVPPVSLANTAGFIPAKEGASGLQVAEAIAAEREGAVQAAVNRLNAVDNTNPRAPTINPDLIKAGSLVTENMLMSLADGSADINVETEADPVAVAQGDRPAERIEQSTKKPSLIAKQQANAQIGQQIALEYQRLSGNENPEKLPTKEAETLGDVFKTMWAVQNPTLVNVLRDPVSQQKFYELTPEGENVLTKGGDTRRRLFPTKNVRPAKNPPQKGRLVGDMGDNEVKNVQGQVGKQSFGKVIEQSMVNMSHVPNVVDKQRLRIVYATALPILQSGDFSNPIATLHSIGPAKVAEYTAKHGPELGQVEMNKAANNLAQYIQSIAVERNGANYLTYAVQGFQGRVSPQQSKFNPTSSKTVRFVTRNAVPSPAKPGSRVESNLKQMYAMMLVPEADAVLPKVREQKFEAYANQLEAWGDRLSAALEMTDADADAISKAIEEGVPLTDPAFPEIKGFALDLEKDAELLKKIESKGEDGPHFIDGLMDAAKYLKARREGRTHYSYFNAYIDGKTNGIASNGIQMGNSKTARQTGVLRTSKTDYLDEGDVRDALRDTLLHMVDNNGFDGSVHEISSELNAVARAVFSHRDLNKQTTMTFGYGKEVGSFGGHMVETIQQLKANPALIKDEGLRAQFIASVGTVESTLDDTKVLGDTFMTIYGPALESVMSPEALASRSIMRSAAAMFSSMNAIMSMKGPVGNDLNFGRNMQMKEEATETSYRVRGEGVKGGKQEFTAVHQQSEASSAAPRPRTGGFDVELAYGDYAYGGAVVGPVQALDAATVALTTSGKSWNRLKHSSGGNPYVHTIYDAFKTDAMGYDVILEEVNSNWLDTSMNWSYLEETQKSLRDAMSKWRSEISKRDPNSAATENEASYMRWILEKGKSKAGNDTMPNFNSRTGKMAAFKKRGLDHGYESRRLQGEMKKVGYDWLNPPEVPTVLQVRTFTEVLNKMLDIDSRLSRAISFTNKHKAELRKEILAEGYKTPSGKTIALQYYAH
jgi:hypothetical protein